MRLPSLRRRDLLYCAALALLGVLLLLAMRRVRELEARPAVETKIVEKVHRVVTRGPERIVTRTVIAPDGTRTVDKTTDKGPSLVVDDRQKAETRVEVPGDLAKRDAPWRYARVTLDPVWGFKPRAAAAGVTLFRGRVDVGLTADWRYQAVGLEIGFRW